MVKRRALKRDPRFAWLFLLGAFAMVLFACVLIVVGNADQRAFVTQVGGMGAMLLAAGGFIKLDVASLFGK